MSPQEMDAARQSEVKDQVRAFVQGGFIGAVLSNNFLVDVTDVEQNYDQFGRYENHFTLTTHGGVKIRVTLEAEDD